MDLNGIKTQMKQSLSVVTDDVNKIRVGRANPSMVENLMVAAYGGTQSMRIMEVASIVVEDAQTLVVKPWDQSIIGEIAKAINTSDLGLNGSIDGQLIRIKIPPLTEDRRKEFVKLLGTKLENGRVTLRQIRHDAMGDLKKMFDDKGIGEDEKFRLEKEIQKITDDFIGQLDQVGKDKETELMTV